MDAEGRVKPYFWAYWAAIALLTFLVPATWKLYTWRLDRSSDDEETGGIKYSSKGKY